MMKKRKHQREKEEQEAVRQLDALRAPVLHGQKFYASPADLLVQHQREFERDYSKSYSQDRALVFGAIGAGMDVGFGFDGDGEDGGNEGLAERR